MLELLDDYDGSPAARQRICQGFDQRLSQLRHESQPGDRESVSRLEAAVAADPQGSFGFDEQGWATLEAAGACWEAGRFGCPSLHRLRQSLGGMPRQGGHKLRLWVLEGASLVTDIGALQAIAPPDSLFQVASQFNCLESPGAYLAPVSDYFFDPTQGPRASISAYPGTLLRHYSAPDVQGGRFVQQGGGPQLNLLHRVALEGVARVESGYLLSQNIQDPGTFAQLLQDHFEEIEVGLHEGVRVVFGANWDGPVVGRRRIAQVFTSTLAGGGYSRIDLSQDHWLLICRQLQRAAYLGTLLGAASLGQRRVVLTLIGGGVFGNPLPLIWDSILWACGEVIPWLAHDLTVIVNGRNLSGGVPLDQVRASTRQREGDLILCSPNGTQIAD